MEHELLKLRPGVTNSALWRRDSIHLNNTAKELSIGVQDKTSRTEWNKIRKNILLRDNKTCVLCKHQADKYMQVHHITDPRDNSESNLATLCKACHAVLHIGYNMMFGSIKIYESAYSQLEIIQKTRNWIKEGLDLVQINRKLRLKRGKYRPDSPFWANELLQNIDNSPRAYLDEPLCAVFVKFKTWQIY